MTAPSPRLRTAWRVGSALAAAAGSAVVTSALVNRTRNRSQRKQASARADAAREPDPLEPPAPAPATPVDAPPAAGEVPPANGAELLVHDPPPPTTKGPVQSRSDELTRAIEAAERVEAAPAAWARAASELQARTIDANDSGWTPSGPALHARGEIRVPPGPPTPAVGTAAAFVADAEAPLVEAPPAAGHGLPSIDTRVPPQPAEEEQRRQPRTPPASAPPPTAPAPGAPGGPSRPGTPGGSGGEVTPDRRLLLFIGVAVAVALLLGLGVVVLGGGDDGPEQADTTTADDAGVDATAGSQPATTPVAQLTPAQAFTQAAQRLQTAGTFAYEGTSSATDVSPVRPGPWMGVELTVEGQVQLAPPRLLERGTAGDGTAGETVTDGVTIWGRSAPSADALADVSLQTLYTLPDPTPANVGGLLLPRWLTSATGATDAGHDSVGRRTFRATLPASVLGSIEDDAAPVDAVLVLALDPNGDPAHLEVTTGAAGPPLRLVYDIVRVGDAVSIPTPGDAGAGTSTTSATTTAP